MILYYIYWSTWANVSIQTGILEKTRYANSTLPPTWDLRPCLTVTLQAQLFQGIVEVPDARSADDFVAAGGGQLTFQTKNQTNDLSRENEIWYIVRENWSTGKVCWRHCQIKQNLLPHRNFANHPSHQLQNQSTTSLSVGQCAIDLGLQHRNEMLWFQIHNEMIIQDLTSMASQRCWSVLYFFQAKLQVTIAFTG